MPPHFRVIIFEYRGVEPRPGGFDPPGPILGAIGPNGRKKGDEDQK